MCQKCDIILLPLAWTRPQLINLLSGTAGHQQKTTLLKHDYAQTTARTYNVSRVDENRTTAAVQQYLNELADLRGDAPAEPIIRALLSRAVDRLHQLCAGLLYRSYPRLTRGPLNLQTEEMLSAVVERHIKAMR